eukprot:s2915_g3.t1
MATYAELQASEDKQDKEDLQRLERHMTQARSLVKTYVVLEPETKSDEDLLESLKQSVAGSASGDAEKKTHTLVLVQQRKDPNQDIDPRDIYALCDCGKEGNKGRLLGAFCLAPEPDAAGKLQKPVQCKKQVRTWTAVMSESSITERLAKADSDAWQMKMKDKMVLLGKHGARIAVGGKEDDKDDDNIDASEAEDDEMEDCGAKGGKPRDKNDVEPFLFHSPPSALCEEIIQAVDPVAVVALAGDGRMAELCLERRIPFFGLGFTAEHCQALTARLEGRVFQKMQSDQSKLFAPALKVIRDKNQKEELVPEPKKKTTRKRKQNKMETGAGNPIEDGEGGEPGGSDGQIDGKDGQDGQTEKKPRKAKAKAKAETAGDMLAELQKLAASAVDE